MNIIIETTYGITIPAFANHELYLMKKTFLDEKNGSGILRHRLFKNTNQQYSTF